MVLDNLNSLLLKQRIDRRPLLILLLSLLLIGIAATSRGQKTLIYNHTSSVPLGFYWLNNEPNHKQYTRGELIVFNVPDDYKKRVIERGWLNPGDTLLKPIVGQSDDFVCTKGGVVRVNQRSYGRILKHDSQGRSMSVYNYCDVVKHDQVFVFINHERSFDSRYYGPINYNHILAIATPLWTY